jgi:two-component system nitrate/nitrite response regulator NarL
MSADPRDGVRSAQAASSSMGISLPCEERPGAGIKVLLVSDLLMMRQALRLLLETNGCTVVAEVELCEDASKAAATLPPDIFLVDVDSGPAALVCLDDLVSIHPGRIIALAHPGIGADQARLIEHGAAGVVLKNQPHSVLLKAITKVHAGEAWIDRANTARLLTRISRRRHEDHSEAEKIGKLTAREREIIALVGEGLKNAAIAERLFISEATVRNHLTSILDKLGVSDRFELAVYTFRHGLVEYRETLLPTRKF